jgi:murein DD-endopeptidase MepM/ murein hydrolase activator NlpD
VRAGLAGVVLCALTATPALADHTISYQVQSGDTLFSVARQYGTSPDLIASLSGLADPNALQIGQSLTISVPDATSTAPQPSLIPLIRAPFLSQFDGSDYASSNCGPTSLSMALGSLGTSVDQMTLRHWADVQMGTNDPSNGTSWESLAYAARHFGFNVSGLYGGSAYHLWSMDDLKAQLSQGRPVLLLVRYWDLPGHESSTYPGDHYVVALGVDASGNVIYNDPAYYDASGASRVISQQRLITAWSDTEVGFVRTAMAVYRPEPPQPPAPTTLLTPGF